MYQKVAGPALASTGVLGGYLGIMSWIACALVVSGMVFWTMGRFIPRLGYERDRGFTYNGRAWRTTPKHMKK